MSKLLIKYSLLLFIFSSFFFKAYAQFDKIGYPFHRNFQRSEYQAGLQSWMMSQSPEGLMYFANNEGLMEFDGLNWNLYPVPNRTIVRSVYADDSGRIYVGCSNDLGWFERDDSGEMNFSSLLNLIDPENRNFSEIWKIHDTGNSIIFQSYHQIMIYKDNSIKLIKAPELFHFSFYINNQLIITDNEKGVFKLDGLQLKSLPVTELLADKEVSSAFPIDDKILFATTDYGVYLFDGEKLSNWNTQTNDFLVQNQIYCASRINEDYIAFGTIQNGLIICTNEGEPVFTMNESTGLQNNTVLCLFVDIDNNLWIGTDNGIDLLYINLPLSQLNTSQNLSAGYTAAFFEGILYLGTNRGLFYKKWEDCTQFPTRLSDFELIPETKGQVWTLQLLDGLLFCGHHNGTYIINNNQAYKINDTPGVWKFLHSKKDPNKIICGTYTGLILFEKENDKWKFSKELKGFRESSRVMEFDKFENIWMSHEYKGVFHIQLNDQFDSIRSVNFYNSKNGFQTDYNINVAKLDDQIIFLTPTGIYEFNNESEQMIINEELSNQFKGSLPNFLSETESDDIWLFTEKSIFVKRKQEDGTFNEIKYPFKPLEGRLIDDFQCVLPIDERNVLFGYENGFIHYDPKQISNYEKNFSVFIQEVKLLRNDSTLLSGHIFQNLKRTPELDFKNNSIHFFFSAVNFEYPEKNKFSTFLKGYDLNWSEWEERYDREITNLREGEYEFYVKAKNIYEFETGPLVFKFRIKPPWFRSDLAYVFYTISVILFVIILIYFIQQRLNFVKKRNEALLKKQFIEKEKELQREALIAEKEVIKLRNEKLKQEMKTKNKELADSTMQRIQKNKFLIELKSDLHKISNETNDSTLKNRVKKLIKLIDSDINNEDEWKVFETHFTNVHEEFLNRLKKDYPEISPAELRLCACLRMNISTKEIAALLNISVRGVEAGRYRLRKTLDLDRKINLTDFILSF